MEFVNRYTRARKQGKEITCPVCFNKTRVYHFSWSAITCGSCKNMIHKYVWILSLDGSILDYSVELILQKENFKIEGYSMDYLIKNKNYEL